MNPVHLLITLPPPGSPERSRLLGKTLGEIVAEQFGVGAPAPALRPHREPEAEAGPDEPRDVQARDDRPRDYRQLLGWIAKQPNRDEVRNLALAHARRMGAGGLIKAWTPQQVGKIFDKLTAQPWGGNGRQAQ